MCNICNRNYLNRPAFRMFHAESFMQTELSDAEFPVKLRQAVLKFFGRLCHIQRLTQITDPVTNPFVKNFT